MRELRIQLIAWLFHISIAPYATLFKHKKQSWGLTATDLLAYPTDSLGYATGVFLQTNSFELMERLEAHDTYHVLTGYGTDVPNEIAQQYFLFGNGKRTTYVLGVLLISIFLLPEDMALYLAAYKTGKSCNPMHNLDMKTLLGEPLCEVKSHIFKTQTILSKTCIS